MVQQKNTSTPSTSETAIPISTTEEPAFMILMLFGFRVENPKASLQDYLNKTPYFQKSSTQFSFDYEDYIIKGGIKPNPEDY